MARFTVIFKYQNIRNGKTVLYLNILVSRYVRLGLNIQILRYNKIFLAKHAIGEKWFGLKGTIQVNWLLY
jgi:hypothetical protein